MSALSERRGHYAIIADILRAARRGARKTHIMYAAKLNYAQLTHYFQLLVRKGLISNTATRGQSRSVTLYRTTQKGLELLGHLEAIDELLV